MKYSNEAFVRAWQCSSTAVEVCKKLNLSEDDRPKVTAKANWFRKRGVPLKMLARQRVSPTELKALATLARSMAGGAP